MATAHGLAAPTNTAGGMRPRSNAALSTHGLGVASRHPSSSPSGGFHFNRVLWYRFCAIAQPYFYPNEEGPAGWGVLLVMLLLGVVAGTYWLALTCIAILLLLGPGSVVPAELHDLGQGLSAQPLPALAAGGLGIAGFVVWRRRRHLDGRWRRWAMLGLLLFLLFCVTGLNVFISYVFRGVDNKMVERDEPGFQRAMLGFGAALTVAVPIIGFYRYVRMTLARQWRGFLCEFFLDRYLARRAYYRLDSNSEDTDIDNPDQRITDDVDYFTNETLQFLLDVLGGILDLFSFSAILFATSRPLMGSLMAYATVGTVVALGVGRRLIAVHFQQLSREADLRYGLIHIRDNAEAIAFYGGEALEGAAVRERLRLALSNYARLIRWSTIVLIFQRAYFYLARLVPYVVIGRLYFQQKIDFGTVTQGTFAFSMVLSSVTLIVDRIKDISRFAAGVNRLGTFYIAIEAHLPPPRSNASPRRATAACDATICVVGKQADKSEELSSLLDKGAGNSATVSDKASPGSICSTVLPGASIEIETFTLQTPTGRTLIEDLNVALSSIATAHGGPARLLIVGPSGAGKSSMLRAIAGLWTRGTGRVRRPPAGEMLFLPQKPYMPLGDLRTQLLYPNLLAECEDKALTEALSLLRLGELPCRFVGGFDAVQDWARVLSVGEQQRLAAARCLVTVPAPALVVLDEATSALPVSDESDLYSLFRERGFSYISVGHRASLVEHHDLVLEICSGGSWRLLLPHEYNPDVLRSGPGEAVAPSDSGKAAGPRKTRAERESPSPNQLRRREKSQD